MSEHRVFIVFRSGQWYSEPVEDIAAGRGLVAMVARLMEPDASQAVLLLRNGVVRANELAAAYIDPISAGMGQFADAAAKKDAGSSG